MRIINSRFAELLAIKERREDRRVSRRELAQEIGLSTSIVNGYLKNRITLYDRDTLAKICDYLGCEVGELLVYEEIETPEYGALAGLPALVS